MKFTNPQFLFGLFAIAIPIIIHLFNFRRYKTTYFSNVKLLQDILVKTKRESQLQHLIVLALRILGISALVLAFAQPYIPKEEQLSGGKVVSLFVDNSFSMEAVSQEGNLLQDAVFAAKDIVQAFDYSDDFVLVTNDFAPQESRILNKDEVLSIIDEIAVSVKSKNLKEIAAFENNVASYSQHTNRLSYYISDFQKSQFDFSGLSLKEGQTLAVVPMPSKQTNNVAIDSCWFAMPVFSLGQQALLTVRVHNYGMGDIQQLPVKLFINDQQRALAAVDLKANSYADVQMQYVINTTGIQRGTLQIEDAPITFDDQLFFVYEVKETISVIAIEEKNTENRYLKALYGKDSLFRYQTMPQDQVNYSQFAQAQLIVLNELKGLSSGLADELTKFVNQGGNLLIFPSTAMQPETWNSFLNTLGTPSYQQLAEKTLKVGNVNAESPYFKGSMSQATANLDMPTVLKYYELASRSTAPSENILSLENGTTLLSAYQVGKGRAFLSAVALNDDYGQAHKHALFFVPLHNIGIRGVMQSQLYQQLGKDELYTVSGKTGGAEELYILKSLQEEYEFIPEQRALGNETILYFHDQVQQSGFYNVVKGDVVMASVAFNAGREESALSYYSEQELTKLSQSEQHPFQIMNAAMKNMTGQIASLLNGTPLWRYFILIVMACFLAEILLLRFWGRAKYTQE